jgi:hypothetical protein
MSHPELLKSSSNGLSPHPGGISPTVFLIDEKNFQFFSSIKKQLWLFAETSDQAPE